MQEGDTHSTSRRTEDASLIRRSLAGDRAAARELHRRYVPVATAFLRKLARRGLRGVKLVISDAHEGIKASVAKVMNATWQRCRVHFMRTVLAHAGRSGRRVVSAFIATAFAQDDADAARQQWRPCTRTRAARTVPHFRQPLTAGRGAASRS